MAFVQVQCPDCQSAEVVQYGKQANGTQRYRCDNPGCPRVIFLLQYHDKGRLPAVKQQIIDMTVTAQVVKTRITLQLATLDRLREAETEPLHPVGRLHMRR